MTTFTKAQRNVVAAVFALTNMGQKNPSVASVRRIMDNQNVTLGSAVNYFCGAYMESDDDYDMFVDEARGWATDKDTVSVESITKIWPDLGKLFDEAMKAGN